MRTPGSHERAFQQFRDGEIQILVGTQMIAKGLDFPNVTLVGVINADVALHFPDFRAAERTFQLVTQVAGRTGAGRVGAACWSRPIVRITRRSSPPCTMTSTGSPRVKCPCAGTMAIRHSRQ